jgi:hypothetical protein
MDWCCAELTSDGGLMKTLPSTTPCYQLRCGNSLHLADWSFHDLAALNQLEA